MKQLSTEFNSRYYFVTNDTIYDIRSDNKGGDVCAHPNADEEYEDILPYILVNDEKLWLDIFIKDGDEYKNRKFKKRVHTENGTEQLITFQEYYEKLAEAEIEDIVRRYFDKDYNWFKSNLVRLGVPSYMLSGSSETVEEVTQIDFTENYLNNVKKQIVIEDLMASAERVLNTYNYEFVTEPTFDVQPKQD